MTGNWTERAARALDLTHGHDGRGPRTYMARRSVALWLDLGGRVPMSAVRWLEAMTQVSRSYDSNVAVSNVGSERGRK